MYIEKTSSSALITELLIKIYLIKKLKEIFIMGAAGNKKNKGKKQKHEASYVAEEEISEGSANKKGKKK